MAQVSVRLLTARPTTLLNSVVLLDKRLTVVINNSIMCVCVMCIFLDCKLYINFFFYTYCIYAIRCNINFQTFFYDDDNPLLNRTIPVYTIIVLRVGRRRYNRGR